MNKFLKKFTYILGLAIVVLAASCGDDIPEEITSLETDRLFSPTNLETRVVNQTGVRLTWKVVKKANSYNIEVYDNGNEDYSGTALRTVTGITDSDIPYTLTGFDGSTSYSVRIQSVGENIEDSKWTSTTFKTDTEQIFQTVAAEDLGATQVTLRWIAGQTATSIALTPGDKTYTVTADDIAAGAATITGLTGETTYTATLMNGEKLRGTISFTTTVDIGNATLVEAGDDLVAMLDLATEGEVFAIMPGEYELGEYDITKSIALKGVRPADKPVIKGSIKINATIASLELNNIIMDGSSTTNYPLNTNNGSCNISSIIITDCDIRDFGRGILYSNTSTVKIGDIKISNTTFTNINADGKSGGDGIDFRTGALGSFTAENVTFNTGFRAFVRIQIAANVTFKNCTFYKISTIDDSNNSGLFRMSASGGAFNVSKCLFVETGANNPTNASSGNWCKLGNMKATASYSQNYYFSCHNLWVGEYTDPAACSATEANPGFANAASGDFTVSNEDIIYYGIGDTRWIK